MTKNKKDDLTQVNETLVKVLDDLLEKEGWQASQVLKVSAKKIEALRDDAALLLKDQDQKNNAEPQDPMMQGDMEGFVPIYIILYQANKGTSLEKWHDRIMTLPNHHVNLSVYSKEETVLKVLRNKGNRENYGYIEALVDESKVSAKMVQDAEGNDLLALQGNAIHLNHIRWFCDGKNYFAFGKEIGFKPIER